MSAFGPKQTSANAPHMSAFGAKADMAFRGNSLLRSLLGGRTCPFALHMSASDPKRTWGLYLLLTRYALKAEQLRNSKTPARWR